MLTLNRCRVRLGIESRGWDCKDAAEISGIPARRLRTLSRQHSQSRKVNPEELTALVRALHYPPVFFLTGDESEEFAVYNYPNPSLREMGELDMPSDCVFVFGSNKSGRHGKGAALWARQNRGAIYGQGEGRQGDSYAIPTKDERIQTLPLPAIRLHVDTFLQYAATNPTILFTVTRIGCGLAGYRDEDIAPMFADAPGNCYLPDGWRNWGEIPG